MSTTSMSLSSSHSSWKDFWNQHNTCIFQSWSVSKWDHHVLRTRFVLPGVLVEEESPATCWILCRVLLRSVFTFSSVLLSSVGFSLLPEVSSFVGCADPLLDFDMVTKIQKQQIEGTILKAFAVRGYSTFYIRIYKILQVNEMIRMQTLC